MIRPTRRPQLPAVAAFAATILLVNLPALAAEGTASQSATNADAQVPAALLHIPFSSNFYSPYAFVVDKSARMLSVWQQSSEGLKEIAHFPADLGKSAGEKTSKGDFKTPEGIYFLQEKREGPGLDFSLYGKRAFTTDYPNFFDRLDGKTGGGIWLHAVPDTVPLTRGSKGCVVVRNDVILDISQYVKLGRTPILIQDKVQTVSAKDRNQAQSEITQWLENWRAAWENKDIDSYIQQYDTSFQSMHMNKHQWQKYKKRLAQAYKSIAVRLSKPVIFAERAHAVVRFLQEYSSEKHSDVGEKVLYLRKTENGYRIVGEIWSEESSDLARQEIEHAKGSTSVTSVNAE